MKSKYRENNSKSYGAVCSRGTLISSICTAAEANALWPCLLLDLQSRLVSFRGFILVLIVRDLSAPAMGSLYLSGGRCFARQVFSGLPSMLQRRYSLDISARLLRTEGFIDGRWVSAASTFPVLDPATGEEIAKVSDCGLREAQDAVSAAHKAFHLWKNHTAKVRLNVRNVARKSIAFHAMCKWLDMQVFADQYKNLQR